ncbi:MAG: sigma-E factor regulatory protein RseB domain-containing protein [Vulcanimicrobiaceae bacterium]
MRNASRYAAIVLGASLCCAPAISAQTSSNANALLREAIAAPARVSYVGQVQDIQFGPSKSNATLYRIEHDAPNLTRRWYVAPQSLYGDFIISRGDTSYDVDVKLDRVIVTKNDALDDQVALDDNFGLLTNNYNAVVGPDQTVAGRRTLTMLLVNKYTGQTVMRVWIDKQTKLLLQKERFASNGSIAHQMRFEQLRYVKSLPKDLFAVPSQGYRRVPGPSHGIPSSDLGRVVRAAGFRAFGPKYLPEGFVPIAGSVSTVNGVRSLHMLYSDGIRTVSLFENARGAAVNLGSFTVHHATVENNPANYVEDGPTTLLTWADEGLHFALVGELSRRELLKIATSVAP